MKPSIIDFVEDANLLNLSLSPYQRTLLKAIYGLSLTPDERAIYRECTGRTEYHARPFGEVTVISGARGGKDSRIAAPVVVYEAVFGGHERSLARGERGVVPLVAQDARAAKIAFGYIKDYFTRSSLLAPLVDDVLASDIVLTNGLTVSCFASTMKSLRGWSIPCAVLDELAFYRLEGASDSDVEIQASIRRGMIAFPSTKLVKISTPYMKSGVLYENYRRAWGVDDPDLLVWRASSVLMNPSLRLERLDRERRLDPSRFAREYEAVFAEDVDAFLPSAWVDAVVISGRRELPPRLDLHKYVAAVDPSGGGADNFSIAIVHREGEGAERRLVHDVMRSWGRRGNTSVDLEAIVRDIASLLRAYGLRVVFGDRYAASWVRDRFKAEGVEYRDPELRVAGETKYMDKSSAYSELQPLIAQGRIDLLDHASLVRELKILESRPRAGGRTLVDHPAGGHDDHANALALAAAVCASSSGFPRPLCGTPGSLATLTEHGLALDTSGVARIGGDGGRRGGRAPATGRVGGQAAKLWRRYDS
ncbi:MAG: hypothetical protein A3I00_05790 [Betaproteobacteria bacterium RIFCSPLOWO2_02_FULL_64_12]|nr:MAG: hypothetical protein A3I00_05790 [Betaproteobacteria bacterium RIFCSPLOWO2_02_FULL_64_12]